MPHEWYDIFPGHDTFEGPEIVGPHVTDPRGAIKVLLGSWDAARAWSDAGRTRAIDLFGRDRAEAAWKAYLG